jgi:hypothetical protein
VINKYIDAAMGQVVARKEEVIRDTLTDVLGSAWLPQDIRSRCKLERVIGQPFETLIIDGAAVLEIYDIKFEEPEWQGDKYVYRVTQNFRCLLPRGPTHNTERQEPVDHG